MQVETNATLVSLNTLALESRASYLVTAATPQDILDAVALAKTNGLPLVLLGGGSNVVLASDLEAVVVHIVSRGIEILREDSESAIIRVAAGENWHRLVQWCLGQNYFGLENLALIPGTVGAAPIQNIGAYGVEIASFVDAVHTLNLDTGETRVLSGAACEFGYRDSVFKGALRDSVAITAVDLRLNKQPVVIVNYPSLAQYFEDAGMQATPQAVFDAVVAIRSKRLPDPGVIPNAGSFFKNPVEGQAGVAYLRTRFSGLPAFTQADGRVKLSAAWMIEDCGWKGAEQDGMGVDANHALVLVNRGGNSGRALLKLAGDIQDAVAQRFGFRLEIEPRVLGSSDG